MINAEQFVAIESTLRDFEGVSEAVQMMQIEKIHKLCWRAQEWESLDWRVKTLEANKGVKGLGSSASPQVEEWLAMIKENER